MPVERRRLEGSPEEQTGVQVVSGGYGYGLLVRSMPATHKTYRLIRKDPTVALIRALTTAPILAGSWTVKADDEVDEERIKFIMDQFIPLRTRFLEAVLYGTIDFGWAPFEKIFEIVDGQVRLSDLKPLLQDITVILIDSKTGRFAGLRQGMTNLTVDKSIVVAFRIEGGYLYGEPLLENVREVWNQWRDANEGAARYDRKIAGSHWVIYYPPGKSPLNGTETDNSTIAQEILKALESSGSVTVPQKIVEYVEDLDSKQLGWVIDLVSDSGGRQPTFIDRLRYLDSCKARGLIMPERAVMEGQFGTKAEAGEHADLAITNMELTDRMIVDRINAEGVDPILAVNFGEEAKGTIWLEAAPLADEALGFLRTLYEKILSDPNGFLEEFATIDTDTLKDKLQVPKAAEIAQAGDDELEEIEVGPTEEPPPPVPPEGEHSIRNRRLRLVLRDFVPRRHLTP